jgi:hypothetical protein
MLLPPTLTLRPAAEVARANTELVTKEYGDSAHNEAEASPRPLDDTLFGHGVPDTGTEDAVGVLDEGKVSALNDVLLVFFAVVEGDLLGIFKQARVCESQLALECRFVCGILAKRRRDGFQHQGRALHERSEQHETFCADIARELVVVQNDIQHGLGERRVDLGQLVAELLHVDGHVLIRILDPVVEVGELVVELEVLAVGVFGCEVFGENVF